MRAVKNSPAAPLEKCQFKLFSDACSQEHQSIHLLPLEDRGMREDKELTSTARGTRTMKQCSFDTRSGGAPGCQSDIKTAMIYIHVINCGKAANS
jgi:hypothetical protein